MNSSDLRLQVLHGLLKRLGWGPLMVAQDGHSSVGPVVGQDLGRNVFLRCREERNIRINSPLKPAPLTVFHLPGGPVIKA